MFTEVPTVSLASARAFAHFEIYAKLPVGILACCAARSLRSCSRATQLGEEHISSARRIACLLTLRNESHFDHG